MKPKFTALLCALLLAQQAIAAEGPLLAVASSLRFTWPALMEQYSELGNGTQDTPRVSFGSSGNLARQIVQGAPFALFLSADTGFTDWLVEQGATKQEPSVYARGRLAWVAKKDTLLAKWAANAYAKPALTTALLPADLSRLSIANPAFAPYGIAAKQVLDKHTLPESVHLTLGENAMQALQFALSGASDGGIVPLALINSTPSNIFEDVHAMPIPTELHEPITHTMILIGEPDEHTEALFDYLLSDTAQEILQQHGFQAVN